MILTANVDWDLGVHIFFALVWVRRDLIFAHCWETSRVHPSLHDERPSCQGGDGLNKGGREA